MFVRAKGVPAWAALVSCFAFPQAAAATTVCAWSVVPSADAASNGNALLGISADSPSDAWAVGYHVVGRVALPLAERWNGARWMPVAAETVNPAGTMFRAVAALDPTDAWVVGSYNSATGTAPAIEHWNGKTLSLWPSPAIPNGILSSVAAVSAHDVWAAGWIATSYPGPKALLEHWNGTHWSVVAAPEGGSFGTEFQGVSAVDANDVWISGFFSNKLSESLTENWNGRRWTIVPTPDPGQNTGAAYVIGALSATTAFAGGSYYDPRKQLFQASAATWNGEKWTLEPTPDAGGFDAFLLGLAAVTPTEAVAVGTYYVARSPRAFALRWNGTSWNATAPAVTPGHDTYLEAATKIPRTYDVWAAGGTTNADGIPQQTLIERYHC